MKTGKIPTINIVMLVLGVGFALHQMKARGLKFMPNGLKGMTKEERQAYNAEGAAASSYVFRHQPRATSDRPDDDPGLPQLHVLYVLPSDATDRGIDTSGALATSIASWQGWLARESGGVRVRIDAHDGGTPDITFVRLKARGGDLARYGTALYDTLDAMLPRLGFDQPGKVYAVYYDGAGPNACGIGAEGKRSVANFLQVVVAGAKCIDFGLAESPDDLPGYFDYAMLHEIIHQHGAVSKEAPDASVALNHVRTDKRDLMYEGGDAESVRVLDPTRRNYFNPAGLPGLKNFAESPLLVWPAK